MLVVSHIRSEFWRVMMPVVCGITLFLLLIVFVLPQYRASLITSLGLAWKAGVAADACGGSDISTRRCQGLPGLPADRGGMPPQE